MQMKLNVQVCNQDKIQGKKQIVNAGYKNNHEQNLFL